jgi:hypothetical protein
VSRSRSTTFRRPSRTWLRTVTGWSAASAGMSTSCSRPARGPGANHPPCSGNSSPVRARNRRASPAPEPSSNIGPHHRRRAYLGRCQPGVAGPKEKRWCPEGCPLAVGWGLMVSGDAPIGVRAW